MGSYKYTLIVLGMISCVFCLPKGEGRQGKAFSIFQIIKFENAQCKGTTYYGNCFTEQECKSNGGTKDGTCADGFGVCCIKTISSGESSNLNMTVITTTGSTTATAAGAHQFQICPASDDICRIRFDFTAFVLSAPVTTPGTLATANGKKIQGASIGDCVDDQFSISSSSGGTPIICGTNTGQHMIVDSDGTECHDVNIGIGTNTFTRSWDITVRQFQCGDEMGGPSGCLQYFSTATGTIRSFNFPQQSAGAAVAMSVVHLSNQHYSSCVRRPAGTSKICFIPCTFVTPSTTAQSSFGLSVPAADGSQSALETTCATDWIEIRGGADEATIQTPSVNTRFCGRELNGASGTTWASTNKSLCTTVVPFEVRVEFDDDEVATADSGNCLQNEMACSPGGITGFSLCYTTK